ncbi:MAG: deoxyribonuclease IV [Candidatus Omnitrophica bacterium]|nr:deoxyribonuclease IV [Candidatus Omnitrophota bacterium]
MLRLGVQVSIAGSIHFSVDRALKLGCNAMQIFSRNPRKFRKSFLKVEDIELFKKKISGSSIFPLVIHTPYTLNLATPQKFLHWITTKEFIADLIEADKLGAHYLVTHPGCYKGTTKERGLNQVVKGLRRILKNTQEVKTEILLENTAGGGTCLGCKISQYRFILEKLDFTPRIGICLDTAHAWCAGYRINTHQGLEELLQEIEKEVGLQRLKLIHLNDTLEELGSKKDRHYHIGEGMIGRDGFSLIVNHPFLKNLPFILETPKKNDRDDIKNLNTVRALYRDELL